MKKNILLSVVVSSYNGEKKLAKCLESVKNIADEIIVVDNDSTDKTLQVANKFTSKVYRRPNNPMLNINKNYGFSKAIGEWILNLDDDESLTPELEVEIRDILDSRLPIQGKRENDAPEVNGYEIPRKNIIFGKWIQNSIWYPDYQLRLFKNEKGKFPEKHVHEFLTVDGKTEKLENPIIHDNYSSVSEWIKKMEYYTDNEVSQKLENGEMVSSLDAIRYPVHDFLKTYFMQNGYKDGLHGLVLSLLQAFYSEIVFAKMWEKQDFMEDNDPNFVNRFLTECKKLSHEFGYWIATIKIQNSSNPIVSAILKLKRKTHAKKSE